MDQWYPPPATRTINCVVSPGGASIAFNPPEGMSSIGQQGQQAGVSKLSGNQGRQASPGSAWLPYSNLPLHINYREEAGGQLALRLALPLSSTRKHFM